MSSLQHRRRARRATIPLCDDRYTVPEKLREIVLDLLCQTRRHDVAQRVAHAVVLILRSHGSARMLRKHPTFFVRHRCVAKLLGITKDMLETVLEYLENGFLERVAQADDHFQLELWSSGHWRYKPIEYRFSAKVEVILARIHDAAERSRAKSKSDTYTKFRVSFFGQKGSLSAFLYNRNRKPKNLVNMEELRVEPKRYPSRSAKPGPQPVPCQYAPDRSWSEPVVKVVRNVCAAVRTTKLFPTYKGPDTYQIVPEYAAMCRVHEISQAEPPRSSRDAEMDRWNAMIAKRRVE